MVTRQSDGSAAVIPWSSTIRFDLPVKEAVTAGGGARRLTLDLYVPLRPDDGRADAVAPPVLIYVHGGGWREGTNDRPPGFRSILSRGVAIAALQYRFIGEAPVDEMVRDLHDGIARALEFAAAEGCNVDRWFLWGISAGGHLVSLAAHTDLRVGVEPPLGVASWCGPMDLVRLATLHAVGAEQRATVGELLALLAAGDPAQLARFSPINRVGRSTPPHIFVHGSDDSLVPFEQSELMHRALLDAGVRSELVTAEGYAHALPPGDSPEIHRTLDFLLLLSGGVR